MIKIIEISLILALGANLLPSIQARNFAVGGLGKLLQGTTTDEGVGGLITDLTDAVNGAVCKTLGRNFLPLMLTYNRCPPGSVEPDTFKSFDKLCKCFNSKPELQNCMCASAISIGVNVKGFTDTILRIGRCCKSELPLRKFGIGGQMGNDLVALDISKKGLIGGLGYGLTDGTSDFVCSLIGPGFLKLLLTGNNCGDCVRMPNAFKSMESFCYHFKYEWSSDVQNCMNNSAITYWLYLHGILNTTTDLFACCARYPGSKRDKPKPQCKKTPPVIIPNC